MTQSVGRFRVPDFLNTILVLVCVVAIPGSLVAGSRALASGSSAGFLVALLAFALLFLTNYSLFHEAAHLKLHSNPRVNHFLGVVTGIFFLCPFALYSPTHWKHHLVNRTDREMFDLYYSDRDKPRVFLKWYLYLVGVWYWMIPLGSVALAFSSDGARRRMMDEKYAFANFSSADARTLDGTRLRLEMLLSVGFLLGTVFILGVSGGTLLAFYGIGTIWWSTIQYVDHAYTERHVLFGALNLRAARWFSWVNLHREYDLNHHLYPQVPWIYLPRMRCPDQVAAEARHPPRRFLAYYLSQWRGPRLAESPSPEPLREVVSDENAIRLV